MSFYTLSLIFLIFSFNSITGTNSYAGSRDIEKGAYYEYKNWECKVDDKKVKCLYKARLTVVSQRGDEFAYVNIYEDQFNKIKKLNIRVYDKDNKKIDSYKKKNLFKQCGFGPGYVLYQDCCSFLMDLSGYKYPYTIEYEYEIETKSHIFWKDAFFQDFIPVQKAKYELKCKKDFVFNYAVVGDSIIPDILTDGSKLIYTWEAENIPAIPNDKYYPFDYYLPIHLTFESDKMTLGEYGIDRVDWKNIGIWYKNLAKYCYLQDSVTQENKTAILDTNFSIKNYYDSVVNNIRYVAINVGIGGFQPHKAVSVLECGYGDCKDMSTLLVSYLKQKGVKTYPVLVLTKDKGVINTDLPTFGFNHVIATATYEGDSIWMDPTCELCPYGDIPPNIEGVNALIVTDTGGILIKIPISTADDNRVDLKSSMLLSEELDYTFSLKIDFYGNIAYHLRYKLRHNDINDRLSIINNYFYNFSNNFEIENSEINFIENRDSVLSITLSGKSKKPLQNINNIAFLPTNIKCRELAFESLDLSNRKGPVYYSYPISYMSSYEIIVSPDFQIDSLYIPENENIDFEFGSYNKQYHIKNDTISVHSSQVYKTNMILTEFVNSYDSYLKKKRKINEKNIKLYLKN